MIKLEELSKRLEPFGVIHGFSDCRDGNQGFGHDSAAGVLLKRNAFLARAHPELRVADAVGMVPFSPGAEETVHIVRSHQQASGMRRLGSGLRGEALILAESEVKRGLHAADRAPARALFLATGDCIAGVLADPVARVIAMVHGSRESLVREVPRAAVNIMQEHCGVNPENLLVGLGPGIRTYELQHFEPAAGADSPWAPYVELRADGIRLDLFGYFRLLLTDAGVPDDQIWEVPADTFTDVAFASHRRAKETGEAEWRHAAVVAFAP